jgi:small-conductance mechanosensitive channel
MRNYMIGEIDLQRGLAAVLVAVAIVWGPQGASAQTSSVIGGKAGAGTDTGSREIVLPDRLTPDQVDEILARLTDAQARQLLKGQLDKVAKRQATAEKGGGGFGVLLVQIRHSLEKFTTMMRKNASLISMGIGMVPGDTTAALYRITGNDGLAGVVSHLAHLLALLAVGGLVYWLIRRLTRDSRHRLENLGDGALSDRLARGLLRTLYEAFSVAAFAAVTIGVTAVFYSDDATTRSFLLTYLTGALLVLLVGLVSRFLLAPQAAPIRILPFGDETARFIHRWLLIFITVEGLTWLTAGLLILSGIPLEAHLVIVLITGAIAAGLLIAMILSGRELVAESLRGGAAAEATGGSGSSGLGSQLAGTWHIFAILYVLVVWALWATSMLARGQTSMLAAVGSVVIIAILPVCDRVTHRILSNMFGNGEAGGTAPKAHYIGIVQKVFRIVLGALAAVLLLEMWGLEIFGSGSARSLLWEASFDIAAAMLLAYLGWSFIKVGIDRNLATREVGGQLIEPSPRARTLLPLIRKFFVVVLVVVTVMIVLSALGVAIGPLLAGAGVVGLAIGFGAQTLVKDIVAGVFFLIDDAFRVGEYIEMGEIRGEVEAISLRSLRLRHHRGAIHTIPFGELKSVTNYNRDWTIYKMTFRVPFDTDIDQVKKIFKKIGKQMLEDEELGPKLLEPLKSQGVMEIDDSALLIRAKFMCKPREQFILRREAYKRIKAAFKENGIEFARRKVEVHAPGATAGGPADGAQAMAPGAAAAALEEPSSA